MTTAQINTINRNKSAQLNFIYVDTTNHQYPIYYIGLQDGTLKQQTTTSASIGAITPLSIVSLSPLFTASVNTTSTSQDIIFAQIPQAANTFYGGPTSGLDANPTFRILTTADLPAGTGTVTNFSAGNLSPLFTTSVATPTTTPVLSFTLNTQTANTIFAGPTTGAAATPTFRVLMAADLPNVYWALNGNTTGNDTTWLGTIDNRDFLFKSNNTTRANILKTGEVGIGATVAVANTQFKVVSADTTAGNIATYIRGSDSVSTKYGLKVADGSDVVNFYISNAGAVSSTLGYWIGANQFLHQTGFATNVYTGTSCGLNSNGSSFENCGYGDQALQAVTSGAGLCAFGHAALQKVTTGNNSCAFGWNALAELVTAHSCCAFGLYALANTTAAQNCAFGEQAGQVNTSGTGLVFIGYGANSTAGTENYAVAIGKSAIITASNQLVFGANGASLTDSYFGEGVEVAGATLDTTMNHTNVKAGSTDLSAGNWTFNGGRGTGTGTGSDIIFQVAPAGSTGSTQNTLVQTLRLTQSKSVVVGSSALATNATDGFLYVPSCAGVPTGTPTAQTGTIPIVVDSTNNKMYIYSGGAWVALN